MFSTEILEYIMKQGCLQSSPWLCPGLLIIQDARKQASCCTHGSQTVDYEVHQKASYPCQDLVSSTRNLIQFSMKQTVQTRLDSLDQTRQSRQNENKRVFFLTYKHFLLPFYVYIWDIKPKKGLTDFWLVGNGPQNRAPYKKRKFHAAQTKTCGLSIQRQ